VSNRSRDETNFLAAGALKSGGQVPSVSGLGAFGQYQVSSTNLKGRTRYDQEHPDEAAERGGGQDLLEYALLIVLIVLVAAASVASLGLGIAKVFTDVNI
jgi:hypothetical protein